MDFLIKIEGQDKLDALDSAVAEKNKPLVLPEDTLYTPETYLQFVVDNAANSWVQTYVKPITQGYDEALKTLLQRRSKTLNAEELSVITEIETKIASLKDYIKPVVVAEEVKLP